MALAAMSLTLDDTAKVHVRSCITAKCMWKCLRKAYEDNGRRLNLQRRVYRLQLNDFDTMDAYIADVMSTVQQLGDIEKEIDDETVGAILQGELPPKYDSLVMALENSNRQINAADVKCRLLNEAAKKEGDTAANESALILKANLNSKKSSSKEYKKKQANLKKSNNKKKPIICYNCQQQGHKSPDCPKKNQDSSTKKDLANNKKDYALLTMMGTSSSVNQGKATPPTIKQEEIAMENNASNKPDPNGWYVDSASTAQMSEQKYWLENYR